jgi:yeast amino acid transporter
MADADLSMRDDVEKHACHVDSSDHNDSSGSAGWTEKGAEKRGRIYDREAQLRHGSITPQHRGFFSAFRPDSVKRNPNARVVTEATDSEGSTVDGSASSRTCLGYEIKRTTFTNTSHWRLDRYVAVSV